MIYIDVDGVIADLDGWLLSVNPSLDFTSTKAIQDTMNKHYKRAFLDSGRTRYNEFFLCMYRHTGAKFLTAVGNHWLDPDHKVIAMENKIVWLDELGIDSKDVIIVDTWEDKIPYATKHLYSVLYDDRLKTVKAWVKAGGDGFHVGNTNIKKVVEGRRK